MINVGYLVAYDATLLFESLRHVYDHADSITLAIDAQRVTWTGERFELPAGFFERLALLDHRRIITCFEDNFHAPGLSVMAMEVRQRNLLAERMGRGWCVQLDADEYIYDFAAVAEYLRAHAVLTVARRWTPIAVRAELVTLFKQVEGGMLYIDAAEPMTFATTWPAFEYGRGNQRTWKHQSGIRVIHQSWARGDDEIAMKCRSWAHHETGRQFLEVWRAASLDNYRAFRRFHPVRPETWPRLRFLACTGVRDFVQTYAIQHPQRPVAMTAGAVTRAMARGLRGRLRQPAAESTSFRSPADDDGLT